MAQDFDTATLHRRLEQGIAGSISSRGSLTKCATKYKIFLEKIFSEQRDDNTLAEAIETCKGDLIRELQLYTQDMRRIAARISMVVAESKGIDKQVETVMLEISQETKLLHDMQQQFPIAKQIRRQKEEYEALAKMANHRESRRVLDEKLASINLETLQTAQSQKLLLEEMAEREQHFQLFLQIMLDLKAGLNKTPLAATGQEDGEEEEEEEEGAIPMDM
jgi:hypothetical protein